LRSRFALAYVALAGIVAAVAIGFPMYAFQKTHTVTKTVVKSAPQTFDGTVESLAQFLHATQSQEQKCPDQYKGARCFVFASQTWLVSAVIAPTG
jgi:hypothetical protein